MNRSSLGLDARVMLRRTAAYALGIHPLAAYAAMVCLDARVILRRTAAYALGIHPLAASPLWSVWMDSNHRPRAYQARALAT